MTTTPQIHVVLSIDNRILAEEQVDIPEGLPGWRPLTYTQALAIRDEIAAAFKVNAGYRTTDEAREIADRIMEQIGRYGVRLMLPGDQEEFFS
jgi:hypothetical protein